jgi:hypothetical protein
VTETKIQSTVGAITAILNVVVLLGWWSLTDQEIAGITTGLFAVMGAVRVWFAPEVSFVGNKEEPSGV